MSCRAMSCHLTKVLVNATGLARSGVLEEMDEAVDGVLFVLWARGKTTVRTVCAACVVRTCTARVLYEPY